MTKITVDLHGWSKVKALLVAGKLNAKIAGNMAKATRINGMILRKRMRQELKKGMPPKNAALTMAIKGSSKSGVDKGELFKAITSKVVSPYTAEVGVLKGNPSVNSAVVFHEGAKIPVTPAMRGLFAALASASQGKPTILNQRAQDLFARFTNWKALRASTTTIIIPGRPFMKNAMGDKATQAKIRANWQQAVTASISLKTGVKPYLKS